MKKSKYSLPIKIKSEQQTKYSEPAVLCKI